MYFIWDLGSQEANLAAFNALNNSGDLVLEQGSPELKEFFLLYEMNYPNEVGTERYARPFIHSDGRVAMTVPELVFSRATQAMKDELWTLVTPPTETVSDLSLEWSVEEE